MRVERLLHNWLSDVLPWMHATRREAVESTVFAAIRGGKLTVTALGRSMESMTKEKHCIKRADRLLSNTKLQSERIEVYQSMSRKIIGSSKRPIIIVDWSDLDARNGGLYLLRASTPVKGRSLTIYEEVHDISGKDKPLTHRRFLKILKQLLPSGCNPIVVTDAGFRTPWFREIEKLGWDWVGRIRNRNLVSLEKQLWIRSKSLHKGASKKPKLLGEAMLTQSNPLSCRLVLYKGKSKGRIKSNLLGQRARTSHSKQHARRGREPWLLATSLKANSMLKEKVVKIYSTRMQIEEAFRDLKSARYGLSLEHSMTYKRKRFEILLLIGTLATTLLWLLGKATQLTGQHWQYQANTTKHRTVLSQVFLGLQVVNDLRIELTRKHFALAKKSLLKTVNEHAYEY